MSPSTKHTDCTQIRTQTPPEARQTSAGHTLRPVSPQAQMGGETSRLSRHGAHRRPGASLSYTQRIWSNGARSAPCSYPCIYENNIVAEDTP